MNNRSNSLENMEFKNQPYRRVGRHDANPHALKNLKLINQHIPH
jgi:hypothetical protein